jgi:hypothetical protein
MGYNGDGNATMMKEDYSSGAIKRARDDALEWLAGNGVGHPRSWAQEAENEVRCGGRMYDDEYQAPPIAGYEALEGEGLVTRGLPVIARGEERETFTLVK